MIRHADSREVMEWMGHADLTTTRRYLAFVDREDAAKRVSEAFRLEEPQEWRRHRRRSQADAAATAAVASRRCSRRSSSRDPSA